LVVSGDSEFVSQPIPHNEDVEDVGATRRVARTMTGPGASPSSSVGAGLKPAPTASPNCVDNENTMSHLLLEAMPTLSMDVLEEAHEILKEVMRLL
jgi:hypothetical protein